MRGLPCWRKVNGYREQIRSVFPLAALRVLIPRAFLLVWFCFAYSLIIFKHSTSNYSGFIIKLCFTFRDSFQLLEGKQRNIPSYFTVFLLFQPCLKPSFVSNALHFSLPYIFPSSPGFYLTPSTYRSCLRMSCNRGSWAILLCLLIFFPWHRSVSGWYCCYRCVLGWRGFGGNSETSRVGCKTKNKNIHVFTLIILSHFIFNAFLIGSVITNGKICCNLIQNEWDEVC